MPNTGLFFPKSKYKIANLKLWEAEKSIGIDAIVLIEDKIVHLDTPPTSVTATVDSGYREIKINPANEEETRFMFYESPIDHWVFTTDDTRHSTYSVNAIAFGINAPKSVKKIDAVISLNSLWKMGLYFSVLGGLIILMITALMKVKKHILRKRAD